nr:serine/threonine-protein kinase [Cellulomonas sp. APG4]
MGGRYRLVSRIAVGGMGEVWVAHDDSLARDVAVKVLREEFAGDAGFLERFRTEARNSAGLSHPNIASLYDYGEQDGSGFLVMELVLGEPMSDLLDRQPVLPTRRLLPILAQTARALHAAHVGGVVHRDVKPGNILLARSGQVKITDFGISMAVNQVPMTASGMVMGTAQYLSPEQAIGKAATPASDVYSLGIVAYEALVGNRPFTGPTAVDIAVAHVNTPVPPLPSDVDAELADLVMRMLAKDPEQRPRSAASLARQLDDLLDGTPPGGVPVAGGRHTRFVDVVDAVETGSLAVPQRAEVPPAGGAPSSADAAAPGAAGTGVRSWSPGPTSTEAAAAPSALPLLAPDGAVAVPGRQERPPGAPETEAHPPVFVPASPTRAELRATRTHRNPLRTSTTTGLRWGQFSRPLLALILMVVFALLGAAFADRVWGPSRAEDDGTSRSQVSASAAGTGTSGMITTHARDGAGPYPQTTTAKDL